MFWGFDSKIYKYKDSAHIQMVFIRVKNRVYNGKSSDYAYLVENKWGKYGPRQKVKKYLGKIYKLDAVKDFDFGIVDGSYKKLLTSLFETELKKHGFGLENNIFVEDNCFADLNNFKVYDDKNKEIVLQVNAGFICGYSLKELFNLKHNEGEEFKKELAKKLVLSGLNIKPGVFVELYKRLVGK